MPLFAAGRIAPCTAAQIMGGGSSAGGGKLRVTPGWRARRDARFLSALGWSCRPLRRSSRRQNSAPPPPPTQPHPLPINLSYPGLNMSRADVTLRLCGGQAEQEWGPVEVKCSGVCRSGDMRRRKKEVCVLGGRWGWGDDPTRGVLNTGARVGLVPHVGLAGDTHGTRAELFQRVLFLSLNIPYGGHGSPGGHFLTQQSFQGYRGASRGARDRGGFCCSGNAPVTPAASYSDAPLLGAARGSRCDARLPDADWSPEHRAQRRARTPARTHASAGGRIEIMERKINIVLRHAPLETADSIIVFIFCSFS